ncbi:hypothetical protein V6N13_040259 [Hibiscus sabdariffa]
MTRPPANLDSTKAHGPVSDSVAPAVAASVAPTPSVVAAATVAEISHDPLAPPEAADLVEEAVDDASLDPETSETVADRLAPEDAPYDPMVHAETSDILE